MQYRDILIETRIFNLEAYLKPFEEEFSGESNLPIISFFKRIVKKEALDKKNQSMVPKKFLKTEWDKKDAENGTLVRFSPSIELNNKLFHIADWLRDLPATQYQQLRGIQNVDIAYDHADRYFAAKNKKTSNMEDEEGREIVYKFSDGMFFAKLNSSQCLDREGKLMQHCVGSYADRVREGKVVIYSLRDKKNQPHATLETRGKSIYQIKGKQNEAPVEKYVPYIKEFILKNNFDVRGDEENIGLIKLNGKLYDLHDTTNWPKKINGDLNLARNTKITSLPNDLTVGGNLNLARNTKITSLPDNLVIIGDLNISSTKITSLPNSLTVKGSFYLINTQITSLPNNLVISGDLDISNTQITSLPDNLKVGGSLSLSNTQITSLPDNLKVGADLNISNTQITSLPNNLVIGADLDISNTQITSLPNNLKVKWYLNISNTKITSLPRGLKIRKIFGFPEKLQHNYPEYKFY